MGHGAATLTWIISIASILCMLVRPLKIAEAYWACGGAFLLVVMRLIPSQAATSAVKQGWNVYLFLAGMMVLAEMAREEGVFDWMASGAAARARNSPARLFFLVYCVGVVVTALLSNDATAVVLTPAVLAVVRRVRVEDPKPYLFACALVANAASFVFPISNPANLVVYGKQLPALREWLAIYAGAAGVSIVVTLLALWWISRRSLRVTMRKDSAPASLGSSGRLALAGLIVAAVVLIGASAMDVPLGLPTFLAGAVALAIVTLRERDMVMRVARGVSWSVLPLVAGLFVIVAALERAGLLAAGLAGYNALAEHAGWAARYVAAFAVALVSNGMNNLPVALMGGAIVEHAGQATPMAHAILVGVDLGPNLSVTGSLATILWLIAIRRDGVEITAWEFLKVGAVVMPLALAASLVVLR
ncbi:MAG: SLC13 family permease [Candidatus Acidiferrales bacterium]